MTTETLFVNLAFSTSITSRTLTSLRTSHTSTRRRSTSGATTAFARGFVNVAKTVPYSHAATGRHEQFAADSEPSYRSKCAHLDQLDEVSLQACRTRGNGCTNCASRTPVIARRTTAAMRHSQQTDRPSVKRVTHAHTDTKVTKLALWKHSRIKNVQCLFQRVPPACDAPRPSQVACPSLECKSPCNSQPESGRLPEHARDRQS
jgi:hypothetical protein